MDGEVWSVVVSLQCRNIASRTRQSTSSGMCVCVIPHSTAWCDTGISQGLPTHRPDLLLLPVLVHNTTTPLGERVEPEPRPRHRAHAHFRYCKQTSHSTALLHSKHSSSSVPFRHSCRREQVYRRSSGRVIQRQSSVKRQILTPYWLQASIYFLLFCELVLSRIWDDEWVMLWCVILLLSYTLVVILWTMVHAR